jgi:hypothetical protein
MGLSLGTAPARAGAGQPGTRILVQNKYYPKPGKEAAVLATRLQASEVRKRAGLAVGAVFVRKSEKTGAPYVIWECDYPSIEAREADADAADKTPAFAAVQAKMRGLIAKFERVTWELRE